LNNIRNLYSNAKSSKYETISKLRKLAKIDSYESRKLNSANSFKDRSDSIKENLFTYVNFNSAEISPPLDRDFDINRITHLSLLTYYQSQIDFLRDSNQISNKDYNEAQLYFNFINSYILYMENRKGEIKDGRFLDLNTRYNSSNNGFSSYLWMQKMESLYQSLVNVVMSHKIAKDEFVIIQRDQEFYSQHINDLFVRYNMLINDYNQMISELNNAVGNGSGALESEIAVLNSEIDAFQIEISAIQAEIDAYNAQLDPLYAERDAITEVKIGFYNQWIAAKDAILVPIAEKQSQVEEYQYLVGTSSPILSYNNNTISPGLWQLRDLCQVRDGRPLRDYEIADLAAATASLSDNTSQLESLQATKAQHLANIDEINALRDLTLAIPAGRSLTTAEQDLVIQYTASIESPSTPAEDLPGLIQARQLILDIITGRPLSEDVINIYGVNELSFVGQGQWPDAYADYLIGSVNGAILYIDNNQIPGIQHSINNANSTISYSNQTQNGRSLNIEEQIQYAEYAANFNSAFGYHEEITDAIIQNEVDQYISGYQSLIDTLNVEIADLQAIVTQYTMDSPLDSLPNADGISYKTLMDEQSDLWDAKDLEIEPIFNLRAPFLVTLEEKNSEVSSRNTSIAIKQSIIDDIDNAEANIVKINDALAIITADKSALDIEISQYSDKYGESSTYYNDKINDLFTNYDQLSISINQMYEEMDDNTFIHFENISKNQWYEWKKSEIRLNNSSLEDSSAFNDLLMNKNMRTVANTAETIFRDLKSSIFVEGTTESELYHLFAYAAADLLADFNSDNPFESFLIQAKSEEHSFRYTKYDRLFNISWTQADIELKLVNINQLLQEFRNLNPITTEDFVSQYNTILTSLDQEYDNLKSAKGTLFQMEKEVEHLSYKIDRRFMMCEQYKTKINEYAINIENKVTNYKNTKTNLLAQLPGSSGSDVIGDYSKVSTLGDYWDNYYYIRANVIDFGNKRFDNEFVYKSLETGDYLPLG
jgi:hypothetical protein